MTAVTNSQGRVEYTLDNLGGKTAIKVKDTSAAIKKTLTGTYDELGRLLTMVGASSQTTAYQYDKNSNLTQITAYSTFRPRGMCWGSAS